MNNSINRIATRTIPTIGALALVFATSCSRPSSHPNRPANRSVDAFGTPTFPGRVVAIADGDTITVLDSANTQHRIRLAGIDAPESHQAFGDQSRLSLSEMIFGKDVSVSYQKVDQYGRIVGKI